MKEAAPVMNYIARHAETTTKTEVRVTDVQIISNRVCGFLHF